MVNVKTFLKSYAGLILKMGNISEYFSYVKNHHSGLWISLNYPGKGMWRPVAHNLAYSSYLAIVTDSRNTYLTFCHSLNV